MTSPRYYYANEQNQPVGPFTVEELTRMLDQDLINNASFVCIEDASEWVPLSQVAGASTPPPITAASSSPHQPQPHQSATASRSSYQKTAETVGMIPDFDGKRNRLQLIITLPAVGVFALCGLLSGGMGNALFWGPDWAARRRAGFWRRSDGVGLEEQKVIDQLGRHQRRDRQAAGSDSSPRGCCLGGQGQQCFFSESHFAGKRLNKRSRSAKAQKSVITAR